MGHVATCCSAVAASGEGPHSLIAAPDLDWTVFCSRVELLIRFLAFANKRRVAVFTPFWHSFPEMDRNGMFSFCYQRKIHNFWVLLIRAFEFGWTARWIKQIIVSIEMPWKSGLVTDQIQVQQRPWKFPSSPALLEGSSLSQLGLTPGKMGDHFRRCSMYSRYIYISHLSSSSSAVSSSKCAMHFKAMCYVRICPDCWGRWGPSLGVCEFVGPLFPGGIVCRTTGSTSTCS